MSADTQDLMTYDVGAVRAHFPALADGAAHFDGPGGSQVPDVVGAAVGATLTSAIANRGQVTPAERRADRIVVEARAAMADLLGAEAAGVVFGRSMTQLTYDFARTLAKEWGPGDEIVVSRLDHDANIRPWVQAAAGAGAMVRWIDFDPDSGDLTVDHAATALSSRTRLVAVTAASNLIGTRPAVADIARLAHDVGALTYIDGVHLTPHAPVDVTALGADFYACSPYKFLGPHCGVVVANPELLEDLHPDKLLPSSDAVPERFELGTLPYELLAGTTAAVDFLAGLAEPGAASGRAGATAERSEAGSGRSEATSGRSEATSGRSEATSGRSEATSGRSRVQRVLGAMASLEDHEDRLRQRLERRLLALDRLVVHSRSTHRTPTILFSVSGVPAPDVQAHLAGVGVNAPAGSFYALEASRRLGLGDRGAVRVGIAPYTDDDDVDRLIAGVEGLLSR